MTNKPKSGTVSVSRELLEAIYTAGWERSSEGYNAEWSCDAQNNDDWKSDMSQAIDAALLAQSADQQGEPVMKLEAEKLWGSDGEYAVSFVKPGWLKECREKGGTFLLYTHGQPAKAKVVLPARKPEPSCMTAIDDDREAAIWNACLDEVAKLNGIQP